MDALRKALEAKLHALGLNWVQLHSFQLLRQERSVQAEVLLEGETAPISVRAQYAVEDSFVVVKSIDTSRAWITQVGQLALERTGGRVELPTGITGKMIRMML